MLIHLTNFRRMAIASDEDEAKIGEIEDSVIHPETGELIGFWVKPTSIFSKRLALSARDIIAYDLGGVVIENSDSLVSPDEIQPFKKFSGITNKWLGKSVVSESNQNLGRIEDVVIETDLDTIVKIYVGGFLKPKRIIDRDQIVKVDDKRIIVKDDASSNVQELALDEA